MNVMNRISMQPLQTVVSQLESSFKTGISYSVSFLEYKVCTVAIAILGGIFVGEIISRVIKAVHFPLFDQDQEIHFSSRRDEETAVLSHSYSPTSQEIDDYMKQFAFPSANELVDQALLNSQDRLDRSLYEPALRPLAAEILQKVRDGHRNRIARLKKEAIKLDLERGYHKELLDQLVRQGLIHSWRQLIFDYQSYVMVRLREEDDLPNYKENEYRNFDDTLDRRNGWRTLDLLEAERTYQQSHQIHLSPSHLQILNVQAAEELKRLVAELNKRVKPGGCPVVGYSLSILEYLKGQKLIYKFERLAPDSITSYMIYIEASDCKGNSEDPE
jgi:hypothetical protein